MAVFLQMFHNVCSGNKILYTFTVYMALVKSTPHIVSQSRRRTVMIIDVVRKLLYKSSFQVGLLSRYYTHHRREHLQPTHTHTYSSKYARTHTTDKFDSTVEKKATMTTTSESWNIRRWTGFTHNSASLRSRCVCASCLSLTRTHRHSFISPSVRLTLVRFLSPFSSPLFLSSLCLARSFSARTRCSCWFSLRIVRVCMCARLCMYVLFRSRSRFPFPLPHPPFFWSRCLWSVVVLSPFFDAVFSWSTHTVTHTHVRVRTHPYGLCH